MRTRRLCERKPSGKLHVDASIEKQYKEGGEAREVLEMALLECLAKHGVKRSSYKRIKASSVVGISHAYMNINIIYKSYIYLIIYQVDAIYFGVIVFVIHSFHHGISSTSHPTQIEPADCRQTSWQSAASSGSALKAVKPKSRGSGWPKRTWGRPISGAPHPSRAWCSTAKDFQSRWWG